MHFPSPLLPMMLPAVIVVDPAALRVGEEDVLGRGCAELRVGLVVANVGALIIGHMLEANKEVHNLIKR